MPIDANEMTIMELRALPTRDNSADRDAVITSLIILPHEGTILHDSGYRGMDFVACNRSQPVWRVDAFSDVVHIDGIGGFGPDWLKRFGSVPKLVPPTGWSIDCLAETGLIRLFPSRDTCTDIQLDDTAYSSYEIFGRVKPERDPRSD